MQSAVVLKPSFMMDYENMMKPFQRNDLKQKILVENGIFSEQEMEKRPSILNCLLCSLVNAMKNKYCSKCSYPLVPSTFDEIKATEDMKFRAIKKDSTIIQLMLEILIASLGKASDQQQVNNKTKSLFSSGVLSVARNGK